ncbi:hypothetical protein QAD02_008494 [Eretmocerus hayati]|uniref:Uncharacterized protein n=1 Tax=Eretmocerus hayati TaxID=131215 RepID=A0ACC2N6Z6_9HYME|nr:hypothetical protein QAD02_008494 [Eretmocerus hayati]
MDKTSSRGDIKVEYLDTPVKSESDKKEYRVIKLQNGLVALLISDLESIGKDKNSESSEEDDEIRGKSAKKEEKMAACGLCVGVGSFSDPPEIPGMAHFLEHMVFMGSERYPQENDFENFIKRRGGSDNASTDCEQTTFYFEIQEKHLLPAMERFAQFFISPLMKRDTITREREAIESEFKMALPSDTNRKDQLFCGLARENHPATKFSWGNLITLRDNVNEDDLYSKLHQFRERHYSAHRMTLAVQARLPLDELEQYVKDCFSDVPANHLPADDFTEFIGKDSFDNPEFRKLFKVKPNKDVCQIELTWVMPPLHHLYRKKPHQYISWIIGHEGEGSLIDYLRRKMWCLEIFSGNGEGGFEHSSMYALFSLSLTLTDEGHEHLKEVLEAVFSYINMLRREGPQKRIFDEIQKIEEINFRFSDEEDPVDYVEALCGNMHFYPPSDYITGSDLYFEYDPKSIKDCIDALTPKNVNIIIFDRKFNEDDFDKIEPWFQTKYSSGEIPAEWVKSWETIEPLPEFHLPKPNMFITDDFKLIDLPDNVPNYPVKIHQDDQLEVWHRVDPKFRLPESYMYFHLITPAAIESPKTSSMLSIFIALLKQLSIGNLYDACAAELSYQFYPSDRGMIIQVYGFNQKLPLLLSLVLKYVADCSSLVHEELFDVIKKEVTKSYFNTFLKPAKLTKEVRLSIITKGFWTSNEKHAVISDVTFEEFKIFAKHLTDRTYVQCLVQGNVTQKDALEQVIKCFEPLKCGILPVDARPKIQVFEVPRGEKCCQVKNFSPTDCNSVVTNYYQSGIASIKLSVIIELLMMIIEEPLFNQLRTIEQLGYNVFCLLRDTFGVLGYSITVCTQANKFSTEHVDARIENFVKDMIAVLNEMPSDEYNFYKESLIKVKQCTDSHLREEVNRNWSEIVREEYIFDRYEKEIPEISKVAINDLRQWLCDHSINGKNFRKLTVQVVGVANSSEQPAEHQEQNSDMKKYQIEFMVGDTNAGKPSDYFITDVEKFKSNLPQYCSSQKYS